MSRLKIVRRLVQLAFAGFFVLVPWLNTQKFYELTGNFLSFSFFGIPLADPLAAVQVFATSGSISHKMLFGAMIAIALASVLGAVFCSWICPYGLISELNQTLNRKVREPRFKKRKSGYLGKVIIVGSVLAAMTLLGSTPALNQLSMPGWYSRAIQSWFLQGLLPAGFVLFFVVMGIDLLSGMRFWCRYCCPQSLILMISQRFSPKRLRVVYDKRSCSCGKESPCRDVCPLFLDPKGDQAELEFECNNCGDCASECSKHGGAIKQKFAPKP